MTTTFEDSVRGAVLAKRAILITGPRGYAENVRRIAKEEGYSAVSVSLLYATPSEVYKRLHQTFSKPTILVIDLNRATNAIALMIANYISTCKCAVVLMKNSNDGIHPALQSVIQSTI